MAAWPRCLLIGACVLVCHRWSPCRSGKGSGPVRVAGTKLTRSKGEVRGRHRDLAVELNVVVPIQRVLAAVADLLPAQLAPLTASVPMAPSISQAHTAAVASRARSVVLISISGTWATGVLVSPHGRTCHRRCPPLVRHRASSCRRTPDPGAGAAAHAFDADVLTNAHVLKAFSHLVPGVAPSQAPTINVRLAYPGRPVTPPHFFAHRGTARLVVLTRTVLGPRTPVEQPGAGAVGEPVALGSGARAGAALHPGPSRPCRRAVRGRSGRRLCRRPCCA